MGVNGSNSRLRTMLAGRRAFVKAPGRARHGPPAPLSVTAMSPRPSGLLAALAVALLLVAPSSAAAQLRTARAISAEGARRVLASAEAEAAKNGWQVSIAVVDPAGELVAFVRMDGASPASVDVSRGKARTAARFRRPTKALEDAIAGGRAAILGFEGLTPVEGGVPVVVGGEVVGAVGVSGVTSPQDAQVAQAGARAVTP